MEIKFSKTAFMNYFFWGVFSSLGVTISTFIDAILVGNFVGSDALAAVNIATPVFLIYTLIAYNIGFGVSVIIGKMIGNSENENARRMFSVQIIFALSIGIAITVLGVIFCDRFIYILGARASLIEIEKDYLFIVLWCAPIFIIYQVLAASLRTDSNPKLVSISSGVIISVNLVLDIVFMYVLKMGAFGASLSLCISETLGLFVLLLHFFSNKAILSFMWVKPTLKEIKQIIENGAGVGSAFAFQAISTIVFNILLINANGENGVLNVAIYGVIYTMGTLPFAFFDGAANSVSPVVSIFAGERNKMGIMDVLKISVKTVIVAGLALSILMIIFAKPIIMFFGINDVSYMPTAVLTFRLYVLSIVFGGVNTVVLAFWQAIERAKLAGIMSVCRNMIFVLVIGGVMIYKYGVIALGITYICSELMCIIITLFVKKLCSSKEFVDKIYITSVSGIENYYIIRLNSIEQISQDIEEVCEKLEISFKQTFFINLIVEELILNIVKFGLKDEKKTRYVAIKIIKNENECIVRIRDNVHTYNPFESEGAGDDIDDAVIKMIKTKTKYYGYQRKLTFNYLCLII